LFLPIAAKAARTAARPRTPTVMEPSKRNCPVILQEFFSFSSAITKSDGDPIALSLARLSLVSRTVGTLLVAFARVPQCTVRLP